ncbi:MAG: rhodanese-like domain-containing protein [Desulfobacterales bacterium]
MKIISQIAVIICIAAITGFGVNAVRESGIMVYCQWELESQADAATSDPMRISLEKAAALYEEDAAVFIDARPESAYQSGHIKDALNLPWARAEEMCFEIFQDIPMDKPVITYCDGEACELSDFLAEFLKELGYTKARSLHNGWSRWQEKGLPQAYPEG